MPPFKLRNDDHLIKEGSTKIDIMKMRYYLKQILLYIQA